MDEPRCRFCRSTTGTVVLDLGSLPACEYFPSAADALPDPVFPLRLWQCADCRLAQLADDDELPDQPEGVEPAALTRQRQDAIAAAHAAGLLPAGAAVAEGVTPHGGSWLPALAALGLRSAADGGPADVVVDASFGLMHAGDQAAALADLVERMRPDGTLLFGFHTLAAILRHRQWNAVRHGHYAYYSLPVLQQMLAGHGLTITRCWTFPLYGGTVLVAAGRADGSDESVSAALAAEIAAGVLDVAVLQELQETVDISIAALRRLVDDAAASGRSVYGYSAASRSVALINLAGLDEGQLRGVGDVAVAKHGCRMPGTSIPIVSPAELVAAEPDVVAVFVSDLLPEVRTAMPEIEAAGGRWIDADAGALSGH